MVKFTSKYLEMGFYVNNELRKFSNGLYITDDVLEIAVLSGITDAVRVEEPKETKQAEEAPAPKAKEPKSSSK